MRRIIFVVSKSQRIAVVCAFIIFMTLTASAQNPQVPASPQSEPEPTPQAKPTPSLESHFLRNILNDQRAIWTSPFRMGRGDMKWVAPLGLTTLALIATDRYTGGEMI